MSIATERILDALVSPEPCLGAIFSTFTFDPAFFENDILRAVLRLASDPVEQPERYHQECRRALQQTPVAVVVDAGERQPGRRLPYDLLEVSSVVFHPKTVLLLFRNHARLIVGSGNLTPNGYGGNAELFFCADLRYDTAADTGVLAACRAHFARIRAFIRIQGTQFAMVDDELRRAIGDKADPATPSAFRLLDSTAAPILEQTLALLPRGAHLKFIGLAAPFFEKDDDGELDASSVFGALLKRAEGEVRVDVAVGWDNVQIRPTDPVALQSGLNHLWTWEYEEEGQRRQVHITPKSMRARRFTYLNERGEEERWDSDATASDLADRKLWMQPAPIAYVPRQLLEAAEQAAGTLHLWLHPSTRLADGRPQCRPLHAKLLVLGYESAGKRHTLVVMGSPNMSRRALLFAAGRNRGNVEVAVALRVRGSLSLPDLMPGIVLAPASGVSKREREFPAGQTNHALAVDRAVHDAQAGTLTVHWSDEAAQLPPWRLLYQSRDLAASDAPPTGKVEVAPFVLQPASAELCLRVGDGVFSIPILVADLVHLPADAAAPPMNLDELLMLTSRRIGGERAVQIARTRAKCKKPGDGDDLFSFFDERFTPTDVFRAWWCAAKDLENPLLSVSGFRLALEGAMGTAAVWKAIQQAADDGHLLVDEVWLYGAELLRSLDACDFSKVTPNEVGVKKKILRAFCKRVRTELLALMGDASGEPMLRKVQAFYANSEA